MSGLPRAITSRAALAGRLAVLPTVWSNCLAAAWLAQGSQLANWPEFFSALHWPRFLLVAVGSSLVFSGWSVGHAARTATAATPAPGPRLGWWLLAGCLLVAVAGRTPALLALVLLASALGDLLLSHNSLLGPVFRGVARVAVYLAAAATTEDGISGWPIWGGVAMAAFVAGVEFIVRQQELQQPLEPAPLLLLAAPLVLAWVMNNGPHREAALLLMAVLALWLARGLRHLFWPVAGKSFAAGVELLPAIVLVDWLAVADAPRTSGLLFIPLFFAAFGLYQMSQRRPAG